ncbi:MAG: serine protease [Solirubrobacteraceae bacterium]|nr:serine protease [Solirubrobacteraceae bacterium]
MRRPKGPHGDGRALRAVTVIVTMLALALPAGAAADVATDGVLVRYRAGTTAAERADTRQDAAVAHRAGLPLPRLELDIPAAGASVDQAVDALNRDPDVLYAEPNRVVHAFVAPNDSLFGRQWALHNTGQDVVNAPPTPPPAAGADIDAQAAWDLTTGDPSVVVGVLDTGVDSTHPDLAPNIWTNPGEIAGNNSDDDRNGLVDDVHGWDFVTGDNDPADVTAPGGNPGHGTHVSGTIAARGNDGSGTAGVTWSSRIMPVRVLDQAGLGTVAQIVAGELYAASSGARIVNVSLGAFAPSSAERDAIASFPNTLFVVAAGNNGVDSNAGDEAACASILTSPTFNPATPPRQCVFPCDYGLANVVCVAATDRGDEMASFSNYGTRFVHLAAPGTTIWSTIPGGWGSLDGTSMAAPHAAGVAALVLARRPALTAAEVRRALLQGVDPTSALTGRVASGGRLNALGALTAVAAIADPLPSPAPPPAAAPASSAAPIASAADLIGPALVLRFPKHARLRAAMRRGLRAVARCSEACALSYALVLDARTARRLHLRRTVARARGSAAAAGTRTKILRLPKALARARAVTLTLHVRATDRAGNATTRTAAIVLRR